MPLISREAREFAKAWYHKEMKGDEGRSRIAWERKDLLVPLMMPTVLMRQAGRRYRCESRRFARFHRDPAKVDCTLQDAFNDRFKHVSFAHRSSSSCDNYICISAASP